MLFGVNEKILCFHVGLLYEAKVLKAENWTGDDNVTKAVGPHYFVHYMGWRARWDEWVPESRMLKLNEDNIQKQKALAESVKAAREAKLYEGSGSSTGINGNTASHGRESSETHDLADRRKTKESRGTKRGRDAVEQEEEYIKRPEIKLTIPDTLKVRLVDDWEFVTKRNLLVPLPREPNVEDILSSYRAHYLSSKKDHKASRPPAVLDEVLEGLKAYFNKALGNNLLYRFERAQYVQQRKDWNVAQEAMEPSKVYGAEHLLRLFVNLPSIIAHTTMDAESILLLKEHLAEFLSYMVKEQKNFFVKDYEAPSLSYHRLTYT
ncbi:MRG-domain-containing protein [Meira miltonrushii]|uniref:Chromatin modification-related protein EAF3 n=1 Tax=Meira miltonrushii TaxID=1280837 RepID=A0A316VPY0_9BASI|nr:MRG-domain-containing protein [Meira miltonrushii]PWN37535.1 MRG-domain-containing protein [Meira miltonrushii]